MTWHSGNEYSGRDMARMQAEAAERVREMQERARRVVDMTPTSHSGHFSVPSAPPVIQVPQSRKSISGDNAGELKNSVRGHGGGNGVLSSGFGGLSSLGGLITGGADSPISRALEALGIDNDKIIIMVLLIVLLNNQADKKLILALCYVLI